MPRVAGVDKQQPVGFPLRVCRWCTSAQQRLNRLWRALRQVPGHSLGQQLWPRRAFRRRNRPNGRVVVHIHKTKRGEAVEPGVGHFFDNLLTPFVVDLLLKLGNRNRLFPSGGTTLLHDDRQLAAYLIHELPPCGLSEFLERRGVHQTVTFFPARISASRVFFILST